MGVALELVGAGGLEVNPMVKSNNKAEAVRVNIRFRPLQSWEREALESRGVSTTEPFLCQGNTVVDKVGHRRPFAYDSVLPIGTSQTEVYEQCAKKYVTDFYNGFDVTIFAYGQTGSGKTYTMMGPASDPGVTSRIIEDVFLSKSTYAKDRPDDPDAAKRKINIDACFYEIYNEAVNDLVEPQNRNLDVRYYGKGSTPFVEGLSRWTMNSAAECQALISRGNQNRKVVKTEMNPESSRSHSVFQLFLSVVEPDGHVTASPSLVLADLAGSERIEKSGVKGVHLAEANAINLSLMSLSNCINALTTGKLPQFRESVLTLILKNALGGTSKVSLIVAANPHPENRDETMSALKFGARCKMVKNKVVAKVTKSIKQLEAELEGLTKEIELLRSLYSQVEAHHKEAHPDCGFVPSQQLELQEDEESADVLDDSSRNEIISHHESEMEGLMAEIQALPEGEEKAAKEKELQSMQDSLDQIHRDADGEQDGCCKKSGAVAMGNMAEMIHTMTTLQAKLEKAKSKRESTKGELQIAKGRIASLEAENQKLTSKFDGYKRAYETEAKREAAEAQGLLEAAQTEIEEAKRALKKEQLSKSEVESQLVGAKEMSSQMEQKHSDQLTAIEEANVADANEQKIRLEGEKDKIQSSLQTEIENLQQSLYAVKDDSSASALEEQKARDRQVSLLEEQITAEQSKGQEWHFVAVTYKSQVRSAKAKILAAEQNLDASREKAMQDQIQSTERFGTVQAQLNDRESELQQAQDQLILKRAEVDKLFSDLSVNQENLATEQKEKKTIKENLQAFKNQATMEKTMRDDLEASLGGVDVFQRAIRCNELEMEVARLGRLNWILDYRLRSATHGMVVDVTTYHPRAVITGFIKSKGTLTWSNKFFRTEYNAETRIGSLTQYPDDEKPKVEDRWNFSQIENIVFDIEEQYISLYPHGVEDPIRLYAPDEGQFYQWANFLYFRIFPPNFDL